MWKEIWHYLCIVIDQEVITKRFSWGLFTRVIHVLNANGPLGKPFSHSYGDLLPMGMPHCITDLAHLLSIKIQMLLRLALDLFGWFP
jgi:hypothetical protein